MRATPERHYARTRLDPLSGSGRDPIGTSAAATKGLNVRTILTLEDINVSFDGFA
jgi:hypothetical protein